MVKDFTTNSVNLPSSPNEMNDLDLFYRSLFKYNPDLVMYLDIKGIIVKVNTQPESLGYKINEIELYSLEKFLPSTEISNYKKAFKAVLTGKTQFIYTKLLCKNGDLVDITLNLIPATNEGRIIGAFGIAKDITYIKEFELNLAESELKFKSLADNALIGICIIADDGNVTYANKKFYEMIGIVDTTTKVNFRNYVHPEDLSKLDALGATLINSKEGKTHYHRIIKTDGTILDVESHSTKIYLHNKPYVVSTLQDITEQKKASELNKYLANHDHLTGLPNQRYFCKKLDQEITISNTLQQQLTVMIVDLDRFKYINDSLGHSIGDKLLIEVANRLKNKLNTDDVLARRGGDEFIILLPNTGYTHQVIEYAKTLITSLEKPFYIDKYELYITASIGISTSPNHGNDSETLIKHADSALYKAKAKGKNTYQIFKSSMDTEAFKIFSLESDLRKAIELNQLELYYQPMICTTNHEIVAAEALIRWNHPDWGTVYPNEFLPIAEETGMIIEIGRWIKETASKQNKLWQDAGLPPIPVSINLSAHRFLEKDLVENIKNTLEETKLDPKYLQVEVVESYFLENEKVVSSILEELKMIGIKVLLDDFGTGYSSLSYLKRFKGKIDTLKIDQSFINDLSRTSTDNTNFITKTIIDLAQHLNMDVVAEGVETVEQLELLKEYNCNTVQGYLFAKPVPADEFISLLEKGKITLPSEIEEKPLTEERRNFFRINLDVPLAASMTLTNIKGREVKLGRTDVLIENIGLGGLRFLSNIRLPVQREILLEFKTEILGQTITMYGSIVWMNELKGDIFQYGLEFRIDENERSKLAKVLNKLTIMLKKSPIIPNCSFVDVSPYLFFKRRD